MKICGSLFIWMVWNLEDGVGNGVFLVLLNLVSFLSLVNIDFFFFLFFIDDFFLGVFFDLVLFGDFFCLLYIFFLFLVILEDEDWVFCDCVLEMFFLWFLLF